MQVEATAQVLAPYRAPIEAGWSTTTRTRPCRTGLANSVRNFGSLLGSALSCRVVPAGLRATA